VLIAALILLDTAMTAKHLPSRAAVPLMSVINPLRAAVMAVQGIAPLARTQLAPCLTIDSNLFTKSSAAGFTGVEPLPDSQG
jgi:hypothetical protein